MDNSSRRPKKSTYFWFIYGAAALILSLGCVVGDDEDQEIGRIGVCGTGSERWGEATGDAGQLAFYHPLNARDLHADPSYFEFNPLIASGTFSTYFVSHWRTGEPARVIDVSSSDPRVLKVVPVRQSNQTYFDVEARRPGTVEVTVHTDLGVADRILLSVTDVASVDGYHCCTSSSRALYLTDSHIELPVSYISSYGDSAMGFGWLPFDISNESMLSWIDDVADPADVHFQTGSRAGVVTLRPRTHGQDLSVELVEPRQLEGISVHWRRDYDNPDYWVIGATLYRDDNEALCAGKYPMRITSKTPGTCRFIDPEGYSTDSLAFAGDETILMQQFRPSECTLDVQLLDNRGNILVDHRSRRDLDYGDYYDDDYYY